MAGARAAEAEAREADLAFHVALAQIGVGTLEDALELWQYLDPSDVAGTAEAWLEAAIQLILSRRRLSRDLGMAYYRLIRALRTGSTIRDPFKPDPPYVTLAQLRREFSGLVKDIDIMHRPGGEDEQDAYDREAELLSEDDDGNAKVEPDDIDPADRIPLEDLDDLREDELAAEREAEKSMRRDLTLLGPERLAVKMADLATEAGEDAATQARSSAGSQAAASAERHAVNGGRGAVYAYAARDKRAIAWARVSSSGDPCHFCAMLIGRGAVYKSAKSAEFADGDLYHDNCMCIAVPIFATSQYETDPRFDQGRTLKSMWRKGMSLQEWRRLIDAGRASGDAPWVTKPITERLPAPVAG